MRHSSVMTLFHPHLTIASPIAFHPSSHRHTNTFHYPTTTIRLPTTSIPQLTLTLHASSYAHLHPLLDHTIPQPTPVPISYPHHSSHLITLHPYTHPHLHPHLTPFTPVLLLHPPSIPTLSYSFHVHPRPFTHTTRKPTSLPVLHFSPHSLSLHVHIHTLPTAHLHL